MVGIGNHPAHRAVVKPQFVGDFSDLAASGVTTQYLFDDFGALASAFGLHYRSRSSGVFAIGYRIEGPLLLGCGWLAGIKHRRDVKM